MTNFSVRKMLRRSTCATCHVFYDAIDKRSMHKRPIGRVSGKELH